MIYFANISRKSEARIDDTREEKSPAGNGTLRRSGFLRPLCANACGRIHAFPEDDELPLRPSYRKRMDLLDDS